MGFTAGPRTIEAKLALDPSHDPSHDRYYDNLYGSNTSVIANGQCKDHTDYGTWSIVGYSDTQIVFLTAGAGYTSGDLCPVLCNFGVGNAIEQDGDTAAAMFIGGDIDRLINPPDFVIPESSDGSVELNFDRKVAYAVGLVDLFPFEIPNAGFEQPILEDEQFMRHMSSDSPETSLPGWPDGPERHEPARYQRATGGGGEVSNRRHDAGDAAIPEHQRALRGVDDRRRVHLVHAEVDVDLEMERSRAFAMEAGPAV